MKNVENLEHKVELEQCAKELGLVEGPTGDFQLLTDLSNDEKVYLLQQSDVTLYTPIGEHFGIVPLESMAASTPVVAMASGKSSKSSKIQPSSRRTARNCQKWQNWASGAKALWS